jgi:hypothetical protein
VAAPPAPPLVAPPVAAPELPPVALPSAPSLPKIDELRVLPPQAESATATPTTQILISSTLSQMGASD